MKVLLKFTLWLWPCLSDHRVCPNHTTLEQGANDPATEKGYNLPRLDIDNIPDIHGNPFGAKAGIFIAAIILCPPQLIAAFEQAPRARWTRFLRDAAPGHSAETDCANDTITSGNLTLQVKPDVYEAGAGCGSR